MLRWTRTATLDRAAEVVEIADSWELGAVDPDDPTDASGGGTARPAPLRLRYLLAGDVSTPGPGSVEIRPTDGGAATLLAWSPPTARPTLEVRLLDDPMLTDVWGDRLTRLTLEIDDTGQATTGTLIVRMEVQR